MRLVFSFIGTISVSACPILSYKHATALAKKCSSNVKRWRNRAHGVAATPATATMARF